MSEPPLVFTNSELRTFQTCRRKWYLAYYYGFASNPANEPATGVMHLGSSIHLALEAWYGYSIDPLRALDWIYSNDMALFPNEEDELVKELTLAKVMTEGYCDWASAEGVDVGVEILGVEEVVEHELEIAGQTVTLKGKLDQLARRKSDGALLARDLKTVGSLAKATQLRFSSQLRYYALIQAMAAKKSGKGELISGGEYLLIVRSKRTSRATPPFYARVDVPLNRFDLASEWQKSRAIITEILEVRKRLENGEDHHSVAFAHQGDWCAYSCSFVNVCPMFDDGSRAWDMMGATFPRVDPNSYYSNDRISQLVTALAGSD